MNDTLMVIFGLTAFSYALAVYIFFGFNEPDADGCCPHLRGSYL